MQQIRKSVLVPYSARQMYELVELVENYPRFLPWCGGVEVHERTSEILDVTVKIEFLKISTFFRTRDQLSPTEIRMDFVDGPFKALQGIWRFVPLMEDACKVEFELDYEFSSRTLETVIGPVFGKITSTFVDAFAKEADRKYGA